MLLQLKEIHTYYDDSHVLDGVTVKVAKGEMVAILGRNGVGKSTTLKSIMGITSVRRGDILFKGENISNLPSFRIARRGIGYVPEERRVFPELTVRENLLMGMKQGKDKQGKRSWTIDRVYTEFPQLAIRDGTQGGKLSGGEQQILSLVRTLIGEPELILIDEPTEGLSPIIANTIFGIIKTIHKEGISVILVDRNLPLTCTMADRVYIMVKGSIGYSGTGKEVLESKEIQTKFLTL